jgi:hypothetical protein
MARAGGEDTDAAFSSPSPCIAPVLQDRIGLPLGAMELTENGGWCMNTNAGPGVQSRDHQRISSSEY